MRVSCGCGNAGNGQIGFRQEQPGFLHPGLVEKIRYAEAVDGLESFFQIVDAEPYQGAQFGQGMISVQVLTEYFPGFINSAGDLFREIDCFFAREGGQFSARPGSMFPSLYS